VIQVKTQSGSIYHIDPTLRVWALVVRGKGSSQHPLRSTMGTFNAWSGAVVGCSMQFLAEPLNPGTMGRLIETSEVVEVKTI